MKSKAQQTRADIATAWIESFCRPPGNTDKRPALVHLTADDYEVIYRTYDHPDGYANAAPIADQELVAYLVLLHLCGPEAGAPPPPMVAVSSDAVWNAAGPRLRLYLRRDDATGIITCTELHTRYPAAA